MLHRLRAVPRGCLVGGIAVATVLLMCLAGPLLVRNVLSGSGDWDWAPGDEVTSPDGRYTATVFYLWGYPPATPGPLNVCLRKASVALDREENGVVKRPQVKHLRKGVVWFEPNGDPYIGLWWVGPRHLRIALPAGHPKPRNAVVRTKWRDVTISVANRERES